jgi:hypothetical protein
MTNSRLDKWHRWLDGRILDEINGMGFMRVVYRNVTEIVTENDDLPNSAFWDYFRETYAISQSIAVRRQAESSSRVHTLGRLIREIADSPDAVTRGSWLARGRSELDAGGFDRYASADGSQLDPAIPVADLTRLEVAATDVKKYVDQYVAHSDARPEPVGLTFPDLESAMDVVGGLYRRYSMILAAEDRAVEVLLDPSWLAIFRQPWLTDAIMKRGVPVRTPRVEPSAGST